MTTIECVSLYDLADRWREYRFNGVSHYTLIERLTASGDLPTYERDKAGYHLDGVEYWDLIPVQTSFPPQDSEDIAQYGEMPAMQQDILVADLHDVEPICARIYTPWQKVLSQENKMPDFMPIRSRATKSLEQYAKSDVAKKMLESIVKRKRNPMPIKDEKVPENGAREEKTAYPDIDKFMKDYPWCAVMYGLAMEEGEDRATVALRLQEQYEGLTDAQVGFLTQGDTEVKKVKQQQNRMQGYKRRAVPQQ